MLKSKGKLITAITMGVLLSPLAFAAKTVNLDVAAQTSLSGIAPSLSGNAAEYQYTISDGQSVQDTLTTEVCLTAYESGWTSVEAEFSPAAGNLPGVSVPGNLTFTSSDALPTCYSVDIEIDTGALTLTDPSVAQNFNGIINLKDSNPVPSGTNNKPQVTWASIKQLKLRVTVLPATSNISCFITDSEGYFLNDCAGNPVSDSSSEAGRFAIIANKKRNIEVATNPGQFYYNVVWENRSGNDQTVDVDFARTGVVSHGQQAIHAAVFNGYIDGLTPEAFEQANEEGIPEGHDDAVSGVLVPAGASLLVTYHLEWAGIGEAVPAVCADNCDSADQHLSVTAVVSGEGIASEQCSAGAFGFKK